MSDMAAKYTENAAASGAIPSEESSRCFSLSEILTATNNFDDASVIGIGGFGKVYKGSIDNGTITVAIKRKKDKSNQGATEFWTEVEMLSKLRSLGKLPIHCLQERPEKRPTMDVVVESLENTLALHCKGKTEGIFTKMLKGMNQLWSGKGKYNNSKSERNAQNERESSAGKESGREGQRREPTEGREKARRRRRRRQGGQINPPKEEKKPEDDVGGDKEAKRTRRKEEKARRRRRRRQGGQKRRGGGQRRGRNPPSDGARQ
ncbi:hypothetical protein Acr_02g0007070 [Actinidia rufa]|uniref:Serine-threonine/tyrosine-protein kinase catalytic domain-containing protein n=1 Tax=Actinidia rufa TaxID=165716 RepID=A0A7J0E9Y3_9ERIC|nr:hypothetical protein Acr_02g0007070 [Actinidia rufa]